MSLRCFVVRRCLQSCLTATGVRAVHLPEVIDTLAGVDMARHPDAGYLVVERRAIVIVSFPVAPDSGEPDLHPIRYKSLEAALRAICAERIGVAGRAGMPGPKKAVELMKAGRWQEVLDASERVEAPLRARLDAWLRGARFRLFRFALRACTLV